MRFVTKTVTHVDGITKVKAKGLVKNGVFSGEYKFKGMTYGVTFNLKTE